MELANKLEKHLSQYRGNLDEYRSFIEDLYREDQVQIMGTIKHHRKASCLDHSLRVSIYSYKISKKFRINSCSIARGALLHDLFLYDWRKIRPKEGLHGFVHPKIALRNAREIGQLSRLEEDIIEKHMFPLTIKPPRYLESLIVCLVDKYVATIELLGIA